MAVARFASAALLLGAACVSTNEPTGATEPVRIFAAASLTDALSAALADFESERPEVRVVPQYGGSNDLARQIVAGAPADLFFSANREQLDRVGREGLVPADGRADVLSNQLVLVVRRGTDVSLGSFSELPRLDRIALADPQAVPAGVYGRTYLETLGVWSALTGKLVPTLDVRGALAAVASGNADAGIVYGTDAPIEPRVEVLLRVPPDEGPAIRYALGRIGDAGEEARALFDYLTSERAFRVFERFGFLPPDR